MLMFLSLLGWIYIIILFAKYLVAKYIFKMTDLDLVQAVEEDGVFFVIKSSLEK